MKLFEIMPLKPSTLLNSFYSLIFWNMLDSKFFFVLSHIKYIVCAFYTLPFTTSYRYGLYASSLSMAQIIFGKKIVRFCFLTKFSHPVPIPVKISITVLLKLNNFLPSKDLVMFDLLWLIRTWLHSPF